MWKIKHEAASQSLYWISSTVLDKIYTGSVTLQSNIIILGHSNSEFILAVPGVS